MRWTLFGLVVGVLLALITMMSIEALGNSLYGVSADATPSARAPAIALMFALAGWVAGTLVGSWAAIRISGHARAGWVIAGFIVAAVLLYFMLDRYPLWMMIAGVVAPPLTAWLARPLAGVRHRVGRRAPSE
ncbi:MAG: hypothetical protein M3Q52_01150 [Pseudomonadota bacterium]|nr:hypothetical protein [Pseudomonadota bacterium]